MKELSSTPPREPHSLLTEENPTLSQKYSQKMFKSWEKYQFVKRSLSSINAARSQLYSSCFFGNEKWYTESCDFEKIIIHPIERRKFRFGLKSCVEFLIHLDIQNLRDCLSNDNYQAENFLNRLNDTNPLLTGNSLLGMMKAAAPSKTTKIIEILDRIESNLHFSQRLNEFFATNQKINPARLVILEVMKKGPNMGAVLRGGSFASAANAYLHLRNLYDHDSAFFNLAQEVILARDTLAAHAHILAMNRLHLSETQGAHHILRDLHLSGWVIALNSIA